MPLRYRRDHSRSGPVAAERRQPSAISRRFRKPIVVRRWRLEPTSVRRWAWWSGLGRWSAGAGLWWSAWFPGGWAWGLPSSAPAAGAVPQAATSAGAFSQGLSAGSNAGSALSSLPPATGTGSATATSSQAAAPAAGLAEVLRPRRALARQVCHRGSKCQLGRRGCGGSAGARLRQARRWFRRRVWVPRPRRWPPEPVQAARALR